MGEHLGWFFSNRVMFFHSCSYFFTSLHELCFAVLVAKRKSLFDDKPQEIQQLTYIIKQDIGSMNMQIAQLQEVFQGIYLIASS